MTTAEAYIELHAPIVSDAVSVCILHALSFKPDCVHDLFLKEFEETIVPDYVCER